MSKTRNKNNKNKRKKKHIVLKLLLACFIAVFGINAAVCVIGGTSLTDMEALEGTGAQCAMVLGAAVRPDGTPSDMLRDRLDKGIELYKAGCVEKLLMSGDDGQVEYNEVEVMKNYALDAGVSEKDIFLDHAGFSTYESVYRAKAIFNISSMLVVTQKYHEFRALYIAKVLGINVKGVSTVSKSYKGRVLREVREILARNKDFFKAILRMKPTYLGDVIDIRGDGRKSWS